MNRRSLLKMLAVSPLGFLLPCSIGQKELKTVTELAGLDHFDTERFKKIDSDIGLIEYTGKVVITGTLIFDGHYWVESIELQEGSGLRITGKSKLPHLTYTGDGSFKSSDKL